jgi:hypothetical protein
MKESNVQQELVEKRADSLMTELGLPVDRQTDIWRSLSLGITAGIGMGIDKAQEIFDSSLRQKRVPNET